jgi:3-dehydroquinate dehydratase II
MDITIINGPNLNLIGTREPELYGSTNFDEYLLHLRKAYPQVNIHYSQSNIEGEIIDFIQQNGFSGNGIILNAGGYSHTSVAIADAVAATKVKVIEVHLTNIFTREEVRHVSLLSKYCQGVISGLGIQVYEHALQYLAGLAKIKTS